MYTAESNDGTLIAYEKTGTGPSLILVNGALSHRTSDSVDLLVSKLAKDFTVYYYDRRGRGDSTDAKPYAVSREIEDIDTLVKEAGGRAFLLGFSSGGALSLLAAQRLGPKKVIKVAVYEPPYGSDTTEDKKHHHKTKTAVSRLVAEGKPEKAIEYFFQSLGISDEQLEGMKKSPEWSDMVHIGHTLVFDYEILGVDGTIPENVMRNISVPTHIIVGGESFDFMKATANTLTSIIPGATTRTLEGQTHQASPDVLVPELMEFFLASQYKGVTGRSR